MPDEQIELQRSTAPKHLEAARNFGSTKSLTFEELLSRHQELKSLHEAEHRQLQELKETIEAIRHGEVDALVMKGPEGEQVYSIQSADRPYRLMIEEMPQGAALLEFQTGTVLFSNRKLCEILSGAQTNLAGSVLSSFVDAEDVSLFESLLKQARTNHASGEITLRTKDGKTVEALASCTVMPGDPSTAVVVITDLTERNRMEEARQRLASIVESTDDAIIATSLDGIIVTWNAGAEKVYQYHADEAIGQPISIVIPTELYGEELAILERVKRKERGVHYETVRQRKNGQKFHVSLTVASLVDSQGRVTGISIIARDITERKLAEQQLLLAKEAADLANRAKSEFLANMSHEIRTPMTAILGYTEILMDTDLGKEQQRNFLQIIRRNGEVLTQLMDDILDLSKIEAGKVGIEKVDCSPWLLIEEIVNLMQFKAAEKSLALQARYDLPIPQVFKSDPIRLRQILVNLVGNAIKFTERGEVSLRVRYVCEPSMGNCMQFQVVDTGIGIPPEKLSEIFQPFSQGDPSTTRRFGGSGLGLAISRRLAETLGGRIDAVSERGKGSTFTLTLKAATPASQCMLQVPLKEAPSLKMTQDPRIAPKLSGSVLIVEDSAENSDLIGIFLTEAGLTIEIAEDGRIACDKAAAAEAAGKPYDLVLMDIQMPTMDGYEATRELRRTGRRQPIIALTAHAMAGDREKCLAAGCDYYLSKPIHRKTLIATVARFLTDIPLSI